MFYTELQTGSGFQVIFHYLFLFFSLPHFLLAMYNFISVSDDNFWSITKCEQLNRTRSFCACEIQTKVPEELQLQFIRASSAQKTSLIIAEIWRCEFRLLQPKISS